MRVRIDDIGASTKHFEQYGKKLFTYKSFPYFYFPFANIGFFKRIPPFRRWGKYDELTAPEWTVLLEIFRKSNIQPIIGITACWVEKNDTLTPFPEKFPEEATILKQALQKRDIIVANHGLTHCRVGLHLPRFMGSNRTFHREFWPELDQSVHTQHIQESQRILESYFETPVTIFVPPGNVWSKKTYRALQQTSITSVHSHRYMLDSQEPMDGITFVDDRKDFLLWHDRELKLLGPTWVKKTIRTTNATM